MAASTYVVSATRAGKSAVVQETTTNTFVVAQSAVLTESGGAGPVTPTQQPSVWVMA